jgi:hypothetical protein
MEKKLLKKIGAEYISAGFDGVSFKVINKEKFIEYFIHSKTDIHFDLFRITYNDIKLERKETIILPITFFDSIEYFLNAVKVKHRKEKLNNLEI